MSRGLLALVPIFAGCSSPFLDSLSVLLQEVQPPPCRPALPHGALDGSVPREQEPCAAAWPTAPT